MKTEKVELTGWPAAWLRLALVPALLLATFLAACGGGDDEPDPHTCYVEGKAMPSEACR